MDWPKRRYEDLWLDAEFCEVKEASHWGLVLNRRALAVGISEVLHWLDWHDHYNVTRPLRRAYRTA